MTRLKDTNLNLRVSEITKYDCTSKSQFFPLVFTVLVVQSRGQIQSIGKCNLTFFTGGGQKCQRDMIMELKNNNMTNCRFVFK